MATTLDELKSKIQGKVLVNKARLTEAFEVRTVAMVLELAPRRRPPAQRVLAAPLPVPLRCHVLCNRLAVG